MDFTKEKFPVNKKMTKEQKKRESYFWLSLFSHHNNIGVIHSQ